MTGPNAKFVWYELLTPDLKGAEAFYADVVGWSPRDAGMGEPYTLMRVGEAPVAGMMTLPPELAAIGRPPTWSGYIAVADVDAMAAQVIGKGGRILRPAEEIPEVGRFAVVADPQGAHFVLFKPSLAEPPPGMPAPNAPGTIGWHELQAQDWEAAFDFYSSLFGWTKQDAIDMGPMGTYQLFAIDGVPAGGMMNKGENMPAPAWGYYVVVDGIEAAAGRIRAGGGQVTLGPHQVPGGSWIVNGVDPQGAAFALTSAKA